VRQAEGDLWKWFGPQAWIVVPTNIGWGRVPPKGDPYARCGPCPMGVGVAAEVEKRFPVLPLLYGHYCLMHGAETPVVRTDEGLILFPTKPLKDKTPWKSWDQKANVDLVIRGLRQLAEMEFTDASEVVLPMVGCGAGKLNPEQVLALMQDYLIDNRFLVVREPEPPRPF
jgi:hypothetical protein